MPTPNALGYFRNTREENGIDMNRDFPYDLTDPSQCMQTIGARAINEIFQQHMFQLSLTFHGGMRQIGYEWGAPSWKGYDSPDDTAQTAIGKAYSMYAGSWKGTPNYAYGSMNDGVYPVRGGMEDWAYAGSWDTERVVQCKPQTYGGYPAKQTKYDNSTLRAFNMLIETSDDKRPSADTLGTSEKILTQSSPGNGHVARNLRLALLSLELVEPYVRITQVNEMELSDDVIPLRSYPDRSCRADRTIVVPANTKRATVEWVVGGALQVDSTRLWYTTWDQVPRSALNCTTQPGMKDVQKYFQEGDARAAMNGTTRWASSTPTTFSATLTLDPKTPTNSYVVLVSARVDSNWDDQDASKNIRPAVRPQSHVVNARTNAGWHHEKSGQIIDGRLFWFSVPLTIIFNNTTNAADVATFELNPRNRLTVQTEAVPGSRRFSFDKLVSLNRWELLSASAIILLCVLGTVFVGVSYMRYRMRRASRERVREFIADQAAPSPGLRLKGADGVQSDDDDIQEDENGDLELT
jgi:Zinc carboxypeptidase